MPRESGASTQKEKLEKEKLVEGEESKPRFGHIKSKVLTTASVEMSSAQLHNCVWGPEEGSRQERCH